MVQINLGTTDNDGTGDTLKAAGAKLNATGLRKNNYAATAAPTANEDTADGYEVGSLWLDTTNDKLYIAQDVTATAAVWVEVVGTAATQTLTNKTVTAPVLSGTVTGTYTIGGTPTFPSTVVSTTGTQTLTNKTLTAPVLGSTVTGTYTLGGTPSLGAALNTGGNQITGGLVMPERADHAFTPSAGVGEVWIKNDATQKLMFTDDAGADREVLTDTSGTTLTSKTTPIGADDVLIFDSAASDAPKVSPVSHFTSEVICIAVSDETTALTTGTAKVTFRMPWAMTLTAVRASVTTAPVGSVLTVDINEGGTTILSTKITIDASEKTSTTAATAAVISDTALANDAEITIDIDTVGSGTAGAGLKVYLIGYR